MLSIANVNTFVLEDNLTDQAHKVLEEAAELSVAVKEFEKNPRNILSGMMAKAELADVIQSALNLAEAWGTDEEELASLMAKCEKRNRDRGRL